MWSEGLHSGKQKSIGLEGEAADQYCRPGLMNGLTAKLYFRVRMPAHFAIVVLGYALWALVAAFLPWTLLLDGIGIFVALGVYFFVLDELPVSVTCNACRKIVSSNTPWVCGICKKPNLKADEFPFVACCEHCSAQPKAYKCHHCGDMIFLTKDAFAEGHAQWFGDRASEERDKDSQRKERLRKKIAKTALEAELATLKNALAKYESPNRKKKKQNKERIEGLDASGEADMQIIALRNRLLNEIEQNKDLSEQDKAKLREHLEGRVETILSELG